MMYMVGGGHERVQRGNKPYPGATRWMTLPKVKEPFNWRLAVDVVFALLSFAIGMGSLVMMMLLV
jgi:hypothetical protein